jgi:transcriptional regulator with GAF, ATPase, and Fis domain
LIVLGFWMALGWPVYQKSTTLGVAHTAFAILVLGGRAWRYASPRTMQLVRESYLERKNMLYRLIKEMQHRELSSPTDVLRFQTDALQLIASYVRAHRGDGSGTEIFVNLLAESGNDIVVVARNHDHRQPTARYPKHQMVAWESMRLGEVGLVGDTRRELGPETRSKPYRSILILPIRDDRKILGAVSIDSSRPHHFDLEWSELERYLAPYVCLLGWTLKLPSGTVPDPASPRAGGDNP